MNLLRMLFPRKEKFPAPQSIVDEQALSNERGTIEEKSPKERRFIKIESDKPALYKYLSCKKCGQTNKVNFDAISDKVLPVCAICKTVLPVNGHKFDNAPLAPIEINQDESKNPPRTQGLNSCLLCGYALNNKQDSRIINGIHFCITCANELSQSQNTAMSDEFSGLSIGDVQFLDFDIFPIGPWGNGKPIKYLQELLNIQKGNRFRKCDFDRLRKIESLRPVRRYRGPPSWKGYIVYVFSHSSKAILECPFDGNATYILNGDWIRLSQFSKGQLVNMKGNCSRVIHSENWFKAVKNKFMSKGDR